MYAYRVLLIMVALPGWCHHFLAENSLQNFMKSFYAQWNLSCPLNEEFSIKFSRGAINDARYIVCIPKTFLDFNNKAQMQDFFTFVAHEDVKYIIERYLTEYTPGWVGYAIDFADPQRLKKKAYFDFGKNSGKGIDSYEWEEGSKKYARRTYANLEHCENYLPELLSPHQLKIFEALKNKIDFCRTLKKEHGNKICLCFAFKRDTKVAEVTRELHGLLKDFHIKERDLCKLFVEIATYKITWIYIQKEEVTIYYRKMDWVY